MDRGKTKGAPGARLLPLHAERVHQGEDQGAVGGRLQREHGLRALVRAGVVLRGRVRVQQDRHCAELLAPLQLRMFGKC